MQGTRKRVALGDRGLGERRMLAGKGPDPSSGNRRTSHPLKRNERTSSTMQGKAFWVIPGPLHVPSPRKRRSSCAGVCVKRIRESPPSFFFQRQKKFLLPPNYGSSCYSAVCMQTVSQSRHTKSFLTRPAEVDEWRRWITRVVGIRRND